MGKGEHDRLTYGITALAAVGWLPIWRGSFQANSCRKVWESRQIFLCEVFFLGRVDATLDRLALGALGVCMQIKTQGELAKRLGVSKSIVSRACATGRIKASRDGSFEWDQTQKDFYNNRDIKGLHDGQLRDTSKAERTEGDLRKINLVSQINLNREKLSVLKNRMDSRMATLIPIQAVNKIYSDTQESLATAGQAALTQATESILKTLGLKDKQAQGKVTEILQNNLEAVLAGLQTSEPDIKQRVQSHLKKRSAAL